MSELKIKNNKATCDCGKDLGIYKKNKLYICENCNKYYMRTSFSPETYGVNISVEDVFGIKNLKRSE